MSLCSRIRGFLKYIEQYEGEASCSISVFGSEWLFTFQRGAGLSTCDPTQNVCLGLPQ